MPIISGIISWVIGRVLTKFFPEKTPEEIKPIVQSMTSDLAKDAELATILHGQTSIDIAEINAVKTNWFLAGWRPFVAWVCTAGFLWQFIIVPLVVFTGHVTGHVIPLPNFNTPELISMLSIMLGYGGVRTVEKLGNVDQ